MVDDLNIRRTTKNKPCRTCRAAMMTFITEEKINGVWTEVRIVRNCGHEFPTDPQNQE